MSIKLAIEPVLPLLRRYARALTGSQNMGDATVRNLLEAILRDPTQFSSGGDPRLKIYRLFHNIHCDNTAANVAGGLIARVSPHSRQALLLTAVEGFDIAETAYILGKSQEDIINNIQSAKDAIMNSLRSNVMIIEDEAIIALHVKSIVEDLGHSVIGIARTRDDAVRLATQSAPELVLADISLADGSSGIDAVHDILAIMDVPVIFITAFPERLLTGERPEPTFLITKPFEAETVIAIIGQALFLHKEKL